MGLRIFLKSTIIRGLVSRNASLKSRNEVEAA
jgi:hypothetical protein